MTGHSCLLPLGLVITILGLTISGCVAKDTIVRPTMIKTENVTTEDPDAWQPQMGIDLTHDHFLFEFSKQKMCVKERIDTVENTYVEHRRLKTDSMSWAVLTSLAAGLIAGAIIETNVNSDKYEEKIFSVNALYSPLTLGIGFGAPIIPLGVAGLAQIDRTKEDPRVIKKRIIEDKPIACGLESMSGQEAIIMIGNDRRQCIIDESGICSVELDEVLKTAVAQNPSIEITASVDNKKSSGTVPNNDVVEGLRLEHDVFVKEQTLDPIIENSDKLIGACREKKPDYNQILNHFAKLWNSADEQKGEYEREILEQKDRVRKNCEYLVAKLIKFSRKSRQGGKVEKADMSRLFAIWLNEEIAFAEMHRAEDVVTVWNTDLLHHEDEYERESVNLFLHFENLTNRRVVGVQTRVSIFNSFGKLVHKNTYDNEVSLPPFAREQNNVAWVFSNNQFIRGELYDKLWKMAVDSTGRIEVTVVKVVFEDGTILTNKKKRR